MRYSPGGSEYEAEQPPHLVPRFALGVLLQSRPSKSFLFPAPSFCSLLRENMYAAPPTSLRPASQILQRVRIFRLNVLRDQQSLATWLLIGAALQCSLLWLPLATRYIILPTIAALTVKLLQGVVAVSAYRRGKDNIATSRPMYPNLDGRQNNPGSVCVLLLGFRIMQYVRPNTFVFRAAAQGRLMLYYLADSPLGLFAPGVSGVIKYFDEMAADLDVHADKYGYLGAKRYLSAGDAARINEICSVFYFDSHEAVLAWAYAAMHMKGWLWWNGVQQKYPHLGL